MKKVLQNTISNKAAKAKIFIIEPDFSLRGSLCFFLEEQGYVLDGCNSKEALKYIGRFQPKLVIADVYEQSTLDLVSKIIPNLKKSMIKVILISTSANIEQIAQKLEISEFLQIPFDIEDLIKKTESLLVEKS